MKVPENAPFTAVIKYAAEEVSTRCPLRAQLEPCDPSPGLNLHACDIRSSSRTTRPVRSSQTVWPRHSNCVGTARPSCRTTAAQLLKSPTLPRAQTALASIRSRPRARSSSSTAQSCGRAACEPQCGVGSCLKRKNIGSGQRLPCPLCRPCLQAALALTSATKSSLLTRSCGLWSAG